MPVSSFCTVEPMPDEINGVSAATFFLWVSRFGKFLGTRIKTREHAGLQLHLLGPR